MSLTGLNNKHFLVLISNACIIAVGFATSYLLFHFLSIEEVGRWFFIQSFVAFLESTRSGFLATAVVAFYAGTTPERAKTVLGSVWFLALALSAIILLLNGCAAILLLPNTNNLELILCIKWVGLTYLSSLPADVIFW